MTMIFEHKSFSSEFLSFYYTSSSLSFTLYHIISIPIFIPISPYVLERTHIERAELSIL